MDARLGNNTTSGDTEGGIGKQSGGDSTAFQRQWDADLSDGFNSGSVRFKLIAYSGGGTNNVLVQFNAESPIYYSNAQYGDIGTIDILAKANAAGCAATFSGLTAIYSYGTNIDETVTVASNQLPSASTLSSGSSAVSGIRITPDASDHDVLVVDGFINFSTNLSSLPAADAIAMTIAITAQAPSSVPSNLPQTLTVTTPQFLHPSTATETTSADAWNGTLEYCDWMEGTWNTMNFDAATTDGYVLIGQLSLDTDNRQWVLTIWSYHNIDQEVDIWVGHKDFGSTPYGDYFRTSGSSAVNMLTVA